MGLGEGLSRAQEAWDPAQLCLSLGDLPFLELSLPICAMGSPKEPEGREAAGMG